MLYLHTSALVKIVVLEPESPALRGYLSDRRPARVFSSYLAHTELLRAARSHGPAVMTKARIVLGEVHLVDVTRQVLEMAGTLDTGQQLRSLDAIHLATATLVLDQLEALVSYDRRLLAAAAELGLPVAAPGS